MTLDKKYIIKYRIKNEWKSRRLTSDVAKALIESFDEEEFIYGVVYTLAVVSRNWRNPVLTVLGHGCKCEK